MRRNPVMGEFFPDHRAIDGDDIRILVLGQVQIATEYTSRKTEKHSGNHGIGQRHARRDSVPEAFHLHWRVGPA